MAGKTKRQQLAAALREMLTEIEGRPVVRVGKPKKVEQSERRRFARALLKSLENTRKNEKASGPQHMLEEACLPDLDKVSGHVELQLRKLFDARIDDLFGIKVVADPYCPDNLVKFFDGKGRPSLTLYIEDDQTPRQD